MNRLKCFLVFVLISALLVSCAPNNNERQNMSNKESSSASVSSQKSIKDNYLLGCTMDELSLKYSSQGTTEEQDSLVIKKNKTVDDEIKLLWCMNGGTAGKLGKFNDLRGDYNYLYASVSKKGDIAITPIPIMILQGFKKEEISDKAFILINQKEYRPSELKDCIIYEDDKAIVYNMTEKVSNLSIENYIDTLEQDGDNFDWMVKVYKKLLSVKEAILAPKTTETNNIIDQKDIPSELEIKDCEYKAMQTVVNIFGQIKISDLGEYDFRYFTERGIEFYNEYKKMFKDKKLLSVGKPKIDGFYSKEEEKISAITWVWYEGVQARTCFDIYFVNQNGKWLIDSIELNS
ncbi:hypothetical protein RBG61_05890 [Paludicola sp. MB14-C6]|uniref:hypothetical protein n=1 Tax=Paludihabitans sp. MB14-C6 TaxID=3070656 RepID=UPI0027DB22EE|nr:hypothetical protein [Paludicola sp. MB14-C6]WMJ24196.1 hypothetical protein RBG61_05890 [Paludicola sp. MB14-C6]